MSGRLAWLIALAMLGVHWSLAVWSLVRENPTVDEVVHLPAGVAYWQTGRFALYHHNPPLVKLLAAAPVIASGVDMRGLYDSPYWRSDPPNKTAFAHEFARRNAGAYFELFTRARLVMPTFAVLGGLIVFVWSKMLYGSLAGLLSLLLWCFCPNVLAHGRLVTTDVPGTTMILGSTFVFWLYLRRPTWTRAVLAGLALGLAQLTKFTALLLFGVWPLLWLVFLLGRWDRADRARKVGRSGLQGLVILALCTLTINLGYGFEGFGMSLGRFSFLSRSLTRERTQVPPRAEPLDLLREVRAIRENRFRGTWLGSLPVPLPREYVLGFDDQKFEAEGAPVRAFDRSAPPDLLSGYPVFLDGVLRDRSWWSYYFLAMAYKVPEGTWVILALSAVVLLTSPKSRASWPDELGLLAVPAVVLLVMSAFTNINLGLRYILPSFPFLFIASGKLAPWAAGRVGARRWLAGGVVGLAAVGTVASAVLIHPHYLAYFNAISGGPARGSEHLIDSNLDWGQDLVNLKRWLDANAPGERVGIAYFGQVPPAIFDARGEPIDWYLPPALPGRWGNRKPLRYLGERSSTPPGPGLYAVSASLVRGLPWRVYDGALPGWDPWAPADAEANAFAYFGRLEPFATIGHSIFLYRITPEQASRLARLWRGAAMTRRIPLRPAPDGLTTNDPGAGLRGRSAPLGRAGPPRRGPDDRTLALQHHVEFPTVGDPFR